MAVTTRPFRPSRPLEGPFVATAEDIPQLNEVFAEAFTERYRKDGMTGVRVPPLNPGIWRYALADAGDGALCWRDDRGQRGGVELEVLPLDPTLGQLGRGHR